jgi:predicted HTH domain antitoxin
MEVIDHRVVEWAIYKGGLSQSIWSGVMPVVISDETLKQAGMTEREALIEIACRLFDIGKLHLWPAAKMVGMSGGEFEQELMNRKIPVYRPTIEDLYEDLATLKRLGI